jgi:hypothetical protein
LIINFRLVASCLSLSLHPTFMMHGHKSLKHYSGILLPYHDFGFLINNGSMCVYGSSAEPICTEIDIIVFTCIQRITRVTLNRHKMLALHSGLLYPRGKKKHYPLYKTARRPDISTKCGAQKHYILLPEL